MNTRVTINIIQTKDFIKFLSLVAILYLGEWIARLGAMAGRIKPLLTVNEGFLTTFTLLARDNFTLREMSWILVKVFFG
jgi:hypothetical protein